MPSTWASIAVGVIRHHGANIAVRIVLGGDAVFVAKLGTTGPGNDEWLAGKAAVAERFGEPSLLVRRRHEEAGTPVRRAGRTSITRCTAPTADRCRSS